MKTYQQCATKRSKLMSCFNICHINQISLKRSKAGNADHILAIGITQNYFCDLEPFLHDQRKDTHNI